MHESYGLRKVATGGSQRHQQLTEGIEKQKRNITLPKPATERAQIYAKALTTLDRNITPHQSALLWYQHALQLLNGERGVIRARLQRAHKELQADTPAASAYGISAMSFIKSLDALPATYASLSEDTPVLTRQICASLQLKSTLMLSLQPETLAADGLRAASLGFSATGAAGSQDQGVPSQCSLLQPLVQTWSSAVTEAAHASKAVPAKMAMTVDKAHAFVSPKPA